MAAEVPGASNVAMIRMVTSFYSEVLKSPRLSKHFAGVPMDSLIAQQAAFIDTIIQGDPGYSEADLQRVHAHLVINDEAFDELLAILDSSLRDYAVPGDASAKIHDTFASFRSAIVNSNGEGT